MHTGHPARTARSRSIPTCRASPGRRAERCRIPRALHARPPPGFRRARCGPQSPCAGASPAPREAPRPGGGATAAASCFALARAIENARNRRRELRPSRAFRGKLLPACGGQLVHARVLVVVRELSLSADPPLTLEAMERRVERSGIDLQQVGGMQAQRLTDRVAVVGSPLERLKNQE